MDRKACLVPEMVIKCMVARGDKRQPRQVVITGDSDLDLKTLQKSTEDKKIDLVALK